MGRICKFPLAIIWVLLPLLIAGPSDGADATAQGVARQDRAPDEPGGGILWRFGNKCAVNTLFLMFKLAGRPVDYSEIEARLPVTDAGSNLADVRRCAESLGLRCKIVKASPESLPRLPLPAIAHMEEERAVTGHYVLVVATSTESIESIDGTSAAMTVSSMGDFRKRWTGHLLVIDQPPLWRAMLPIPIILGLVSILVALWMQTKLARSRRRAEASLHAPSSIAS